MAQKTAADIVLDFTLEHYITSKKVQGGKTVRVTRKELSGGATQVLTQFLTAHGISEEDAPARLKEHFDSVLATQTNSPFGMRQKFDSTKLYTVCGGLLILAGLIGVFSPTTDKFFYGCIALMGVIVLWMGLDPLPKAMTKFWTERNMSPEHITLNQLNDLHALVEKTARKGTISK